MKPPIQSAFFSGGPHNGNTYPLKRTPTRIVIEELGTYWLEERPWGHQYTWRNKAGRKKRK